MPQKTTTIDPLVGKFFHSFVDVDGNRKIQFQGQFMARVNEDHYLVLFYDAIIGAPSTQSIISITSMYDWNIYDTADEMNDWYEHHPYHR